MWRPDDPVVGEEIELYFKVWRHNGGNPEVGLEQPQLLNDAGFSEMRISAWFEDISGSVESIAKWFLQPEFVQTVKAQRWGDEKSVQSVHDRLIQWSKKPRAFWMIASGEAATRKP